VPRGGHNVLEAAVAGKPVMVGPYMHNFQEMAQQFLAEGALVEVRSAEELAREATSLLTDAERRRRIGERARALVIQNRGALQRTVEALAGLLA
jgi:3-deoxy-D-manno-octulosonic-acid transferase